MPNREIDDNASKYRYRDSVFNGKKSAMDEYTGQRIFSTKSHSMEKTANVDHVTPIAVINERYKDLSVEQRRKLANSESNYAITNAYLNSVEKKALENHEYLGKKAGSMTKSLFSGDLEKAGTEFSDLTAQTPRMLAKEAKSRINMEIQANGYRIENAVEDLKEMDIPMMGGIEEISAGVSFSIMVLGVENIFAVASGQKTMEDAGKEIRGMAVETALTKGKIKATKKVISEMGQKLSSDFLKEFAESSNEVAQVVEMGTLVVKSFIKLVDGEISGLEFLDEIGEKGFSLAGDLVGSIAGAGIMEALLPASVAAGPGGILIGAAAIAGAMVMSTICTGIYHCTQKLRDDYLAKEREYKNKLSRINRIADMAILEMQYQQRELTKMIAEQKADWAESFHTGFSVILESMFNNDFEQLSEGVNHILKVFGETVLFKNMDEFDQFFFDDDAVLTL